MFYDAMIVSGVPVPKAKLMYFAVYWSGPRWEARVTLNNRMPVDTSFHLFRLKAKLDELIPDIASVDIVNIPSPGGAYAGPQAAVILSGLTDKITVMDLEAIERLAESLTADPPATG